MVEAEPALLNLFRQTRQSFIDRGPRTEMTQSLGLAVLQGFFQMEPTLVIHVVVEVDIHTSGLVGNQEPTCLRQRIAVCLGIHEDRSYTERSLQEALDCIVRQARLLTDFLTRQTVIGIAQKVEDSPLHHQA